MLPSFVLALREGLEAALIIGIVLGALHRLNRTDLNPVVWRGVVSAVAASLVAGFTLYRIGIEFEGRNEEIFEGVSMLLAAGLLTWMIIWMARHARNLKQEIETNVREATFKTGRAALFLLAFLAVVREGVELALFLLATQYASNAVGTYFGAALGLLGAAVLGLSLFSTTNRLNLRRFFQVTNVILILFAAGLVAHGTHELIEAGWVPAIVENVWNLNPILDESSIAGEFLKALLGYNGNPALSEILAYLGYFAVLYFSLNVVFNRSRSKPSTA